MKTGLMTSITLILLLGSLVQAKNKSTGETRINDDSTVINPITGEQVIANQLMLTFENDVTESCILQLLQSNELKILSYSPAMHIYHVGLTKHPTDFQYLSDLQIRLESRKEISYVNLCKVFSGQSGELDFSQGASPRRKGTITLNESQMPLIEDRPLTVNGTILKHKPALISCLGRSGQQAKKSSGMVTFQIIVSAGGEVERAQIIKTTVSNKNIVRCLLNKIRNWKDFPAGKNTSTVSFTFEF